MARKKETHVEEPPSDTNGHANGNGQNPRKTVRKFTAQSGKETTIQVEVVENEYQTQAGEKVTYLCAVCSRLYVKSDGQLGTSYSYRQYDVPVLIHLLQKAHAFICDQRVVEDVPFA